MEVTAIQDSWCAVVNIYAATKKASSMWRRADKMLDSLNVRFETFFTGKDGNAMSLAHSACESGYRKFIAAGGDGTIHDVLEGIMLFVESRSFTDSPVSLSEFTLSVVPLGSGNDWIKTAGIPKDIAKAVSLFREGSIAKQDVVKASLLDPVHLPEEKVQRVSYMANVGGVGLDARVCERVNNAKKKGRSGKQLYVSALIHNIIHRAPASAKVVCDGKTIFAGSFLSMAFGIGKYSGGGMRQTPDAILDDGLLDICIIPELPLLKIAKEAPKLFNGRFNTVKELVMTRGKSITVLPYTDNPSNICSGEPVEVDGEVTGVAPVRFDVLEDQLNILVPTSL
ncbi:MAG: diacylglycerol kinase family lipid kinase [Bacteroidales bacterium]|nr:diacylglycerol kinase family lipid kinase [Bacteroidales bacterium]